MVIHMTFQDAVRIVRANQSGTNLFQGKAITNAQLRKAHRVIAEGTK